MKRRKMTQLFLLGAGGMVIVPQTILSSCTKEETPGPDPGGNNNNGPLLEIDLSDPKYSALNNAGSFVEISGIIVINLGTDGFVALSSKCTHQGCTVSYSAANSNLPCPCHGSVFSVSGSVVNGPAQSPLRKYEVKRSGDVLQID